MKPGETREMTVVFYVDPAIVEGLASRTTLNTITLSYTFYRAAPTPQRPVADNAGPQFEQGASTPNA